MSKLTADQMFQTAVGHHQAGQLAQAETLYRQILAQQPKHAGALHHLGLIAQNTGHIDIAVDLIRQAIALQPGNPYAHTNLGNILQSKGRFDEAIAAHRQAVVLQPGNATAYSNLGNALRSRGLAEEAIDVCRKAIAIKPDLPEAYNNLGNALKDMGQLDEAIAAYRRAIVIKPDFPEAYNNLGNALTDKGELDEAIATYHQALVLQPESASAYSNLGNALRAANRPEEAIAACRTAISLKPDFAEAHNNLGNALKANDQMKEAITAYRQAVALKPNYAEGFNNLGSALSEADQLIESISACRQAIALKPNFHDAYNNLGNRLKKAGQLDEAIAAYRQAIDLKPDFSQPYCNLGIALQAKGQFDEAIVAYRQAVTLKPDYPDAFCNLGVALMEKSQLPDSIAASRQAIVLNPKFALAYNNLGNALKDNGQLSDAVAALREAILIDPDYADAYSNLANVLREEGRLDDAIALYRQAIEVKPEYVDAHSNLVYTIQFHPDYDAPAIAGEHARWNEQHAEPLKKFIKPHLNNRGPDRRIRVAYISPDFRNHPVGRSLLSLLSHHDRSHFEIVCYRDGGPSDVITQKLKQLSGQWHEIAGLSDEQVAQKVRDDQIDILADTTLHTSHNRLLAFAQKPAPVQVTLLGPPTTTGLTTMDYRLTDPYLDPPGEGDANYSEQSIRLPNCFWIYTTIEGTPDVNPLPATQNGFVTFGCLNQFSKVTAPVLELWIKILLATPRSRLLIQSHPGDHLNKLRDLFAGHGITHERLEFVGKVPTKEYFHLYHRVDLSLDPFPFNGHTSTMDAFWMGVPVVTLAGRTAVGRGGVSLLSNIGLTDLIAHSPEDYVSIAVNLANDLPRLTILRSSLRGRMLASPLVDAPLFTRNVEAAYRQMWRKWCGMAQVP